MDDIVTRMQQLTRGLFAELIGVRFVEASPERIKATLAVRDDLCTVPGIMHGGALMAFADTLGAFATGMNLPGGATTTTIESKTNFFAPAKAGATITGECVALHRGKRTMAWQTRVTGEDGKMIALVTQTQMVLAATPSPQETMAELFAGRSPAEQKALLASLQRAGAALYRAWAANEDDRRVAVGLEAAAKREEDNAALLEEG